MAHRLNTNKQFMVGNGILAFAVIFVVVIFVYMSMRLQREKQEERHFIESYTISLVKGFAGDSISLFVNDSLISNKTISEEPYTVEVGRFAEQSALLIVDNNTELVAFKGFSKSENQQARCSAGLAVVFRTNSPQIDLLPSYKWEYRKDNVTGIAAAGFDLYIRQNNEWIYANSLAPAKRNEAFTLMYGMEPKEKECLLYLPMYSELESLKIGIQPGSSIETIPNPFGQKVVFFGSSFTQGIGASRPGMSYPLQIERNTNLHVCNLGFSGNAKLQSYFAEVIAATEADAFVFDVFSNPDAMQIKERLQAFVDIIVAKHPKTPLIFVQTIQRGNEAFNTLIRARESDKLEIVETLMKEIIRKYPNIYLIGNPLPSPENRDTCTDGTHPSDLGYYFWAKNLEKKIIEILNKNKCL